MAVSAAQPDTKQSVAEFHSAFAEHRKRALRSHTLFTAIFLVALAVAIQVGEFYPSRIIDGIPRLGAFFERILPTLRWESLGADFGEWFYAWDIWLGMLVETILIAFFATLIGVIGGLLLSFPASRNLNSSRIGIFAARRVLETARTVPDLVWALIFVFAFGVGPLAGALAIGLHATGALGKLYSEVNENIDMRPVEGVRAAGGSWAQMIRYAVVPQILPNILSYTLLRFEINVRSSSIIGYVGAGGLGRELRQVISFQEYESITALFVIILVTVIVIDFSCEKVRHRFIGLFGAR